MSQDGSHSQAATQADAEEALAAAFDLHVLCEGSPGLDEKTTEKLWSAERSKTALERLSYVSEATARELVTNASLKRVERVIADTPNQDERLLALRRELEICKSVLKIVGELPEIRRVAVRCQKLGFYPPKLVHGLLDSVFEVLERIRTGEDSGVVEVIIEKDGQSGRIRKSDKSRGSGVLDGKPAEPTDIN